tara:strand:+ start:11350 stop:12627 length:1278 start_codon:yes stop_codon:yes gene_type:complete
MAKLNTPLQVQSSFPQLAQQYATTIQRNKVMQERERKQLQAESKQEARVQGALTAGVEGLQANTGLYGIGQSLYQDYITAEESGDVEGAEVIKNYLDKFMTSSAGYIRSEQNLLSGILNDPAKLSQFEDSSSDVVNAAETNTLKNYTTKKEGNQYVISDDDGNQYGLFNIPELTGNGSFMGALTPVQKIPNYVNATSFGEKHSRAILTRNDIVDETGRITNPTGITDYLSNEFDLEIRKNPDFLKGLVYDDQFIKGGMETFNEDSVDRLLESEDYVNGLRDKYLKNAVGVVNAYEKVKPEEVDKAKDPFRVTKIPMHRGSNGLMEVEFAGMGKQIQYIREEGSQTIMTNILRIGASIDGGLELTDNVYVDADGNPVIDITNATNYQTVTRVIKPGDREWFKLTSVMGGEESMQELIKRLDPGLKM